MMCGRLEDETSTATCGATSAQVEAYALAIARVARRAAELERGGARGQAARDAYRRAEFAGDKE